MILYTFNYIANLATSFSGVALLIYALCILLPPSPSFKSVYVPHSIEPLNYIYLGYSFFLAPLVGCWAVVLNRQPILVIYLMVLLICVMTESLLFSGLISAQVYVEENSDMLHYERQVMETIRNNYYKVDIARGMMNMLQENHKCCGVQSFDEYEDDLVPLSCCENPSKINNTLWKCYKKSAYSQGCLRALTTLFQGDFSHERFIILCYSIQIPTIAASLFLLNSQERTMNKYVR